MLSVDCDVARLERFQLQRQRVVRWRAIGEEAQDEQQVECAERVRRASWPRSRPDSAVPLSSAIWVGNTSQQPLGWARGQGRSRKRSHRREPRPKPGRRQKTTAQWPKPEQRPDSF